MTKAGRYEIVGELGRGAMGVVYRAVDPVIGRTVAVKTIRLSEEGTGMSRPELLQRFQTEAHAAGQLTHPNIVVVYDAGEEEGGLYYITMELVEGKSLQALLDARQAFPLPRVIHILEQACGALQFAHERNIVHCDIKPANLMLTPDDTLKITDFGTAKILQFGTTHQTAHVIGTPSYMSPEQVKGRPVDGRSDIFSLGVVLYEMVTGEKPFPGQNITTVIYKIVNEDPVPPRQIDPSIHPGISQVVMKALAKAPEARYQNCHDMLEDLKNFRSLGGTADATMALPGVGPLPRASGHPSDSGRLPAAVSGAVPAVRRSGSIAPLQPEKRKSRTASALLALCLLGIIGYCGYRLKPYMLELWHRAHAQQDSLADAAPAALSTRTTEKPANAPFGENESAPNGAVVVGSVDISPPHPAVETSAGNGEHVKPEMLSAPPKVAAPSPTSAGAGRGERVTADPSRAIKRVPVAPANPGTGLSVAAAEFRGRIEQALREMGLASRVKLEGMGNTLMLSGKLRPGEHGELLKRLREAPAGVQIVDDIEYEAVPDRPASSARTVERPVLRAGLGGINIKTDVAGATAVLRGPHGRELEQCQTPCSFINLFPAQYSLEIRKDGYRPVQTALQVKFGAMVEQKISLEATAMGLFVNTKPDGADVFINGAKQSGETPVSLPLAAGDYNLVLRKDGFEPYVGHVQVKSDVQTQLDVELTAKSVHVAWVMARSEPPGASVLVDGVATGQSTPARVQMTAGMHAVTLLLPGREPVTRRVVVDEGQTVQVSEDMQK